MSDIDPNIQTPKKAPTKYIDDAKLNFQSSEHLKFIELLMEWLKIDVE